MLLLDVDEKQMNKLVNKISDSISNTYIENISLTIVIGYYLKKDDSKTLEEAHKIAEDNMYKDKISSIKIALHLLYFLEILYNKTTLVKEMIMINRRRTYMNIALFSITIVTIIALYSGANRNISLYITEVTYVTSIMVLLIIIQVSILIYTTIKEIRDLSYKLFIRFEVNLPKYSSKSTKESFSAIYSIIVSHIKLQVIRC